MMFWNSLKKMAILYMKRMRNKSLYSGLYQVVLDISINQFGERWCTA